MEKELVFQRSTDKCWKSWKSWSFKRTILNNITTSESEIGEKIIINWNNICKLIIKLKD